MIRAIRTLSVLVGLVGNLIPLYGSCTGNGAHTARARRC